MKRCGGSATLKRRKAERSVPTVSLQPKLRRSELKPGMEVWNTVSGRFGIVRADPDNPTKIDHSAPWCVPIRRRMLSGKLTYLYWRLQHVASVKGMT